MQKDIIRFDIAMHDTGSMYFCKQITDRQNDLGATREIESSFHFQLFRESMSLQQFHHQIWDAATGDTGIKHRDGIGMIDPAGGDSFQTKAFQILSRIAKTGAKDLDRDRMGK